MEEIGQEQASSTPVESTQTSTQQAEDHAQAVADLAKLERVKWFDGKEYSRDDLKKAAMWQSDYTKKTQALAEERKAFQEERKFYENLAADLEHVRRNPNLATQFVQIYPQKFHEYLKQVMNGGTPQVQTQQQPQVPVELMSQINQLQQFYNEQQIVKNETVLNKMLDSAQKKYPEAIPDLAIARLYEMHSQGNQVTEDLVEQVFKQAQDQVSAHFKARYGKMVKEQIDANKRARGDGLGGGTPGEAPRKFKNLKDVTEHAIKDLTSRA